MRGQLTTYERREGIRQYLINKKFATARQLAFIFNVTRQTIVNDIVFLSSRLPITTKFGVKGGVFLDMEFENPKEFLNDEELELLLNLFDTLEEKEKLLMMNIINKFSLPKDKQNSDMMFDKVCMQDNGM